MANKYQSREEREAAEFERLGVTPPKVSPHGHTLEEIAELLKEKEMPIWRQEGNQLIGESERGRFVQTVPTHKLLIGTDKKGLPIFRDIVL